MKIRFMHRHLKVLVTRISGFFNIEIENGWDSKLTQGSFKISDNLIYDVILKKITEVTSLTRYTYDIHTKKIYHSISSPSFLTRQGHIIFEIKHGKVVDVEVDNPIPIETIFSTETGRIIFEKSKEELPKTVKKFLDKKNL